MPAAPHVPACRSPTLTHGSGATGCLLYFRHGRVHSTAHHAWIQPACSLSNLVCVRALMLFVLATCHVSRPLLDALELSHLFDDIIVSAEVRPTAAH